MTKKMKKTATKKKTTKKKNKTMTKKKKRKKQNASYKDEKVSLVN